MLLSILSIIALFIILYFFFVSFYPAFGGDVSNERKAIYESSVQYDNGKFINLKKEIPEAASFSKMLSIGRKFFFEKVENGRSDSDLKVQKIDSTHIAHNPHDAKLMWFGHSAFLLQLDDINILIDPMLGDVPAPHPLLGAKRFNSELPIPMEKLPQIDALVISHDHYDHLDYESIKKLQHKVERYFVPLGVGVHLEAWGVASSKITEMDWWEETTYKDIQLACTPAQHFSGRKFTNGQSTLWSSWVIKTDSTSIYFSGDSGYGSHFKEIGEQYGPFDLAMMEYL